MSRTVEEWGRLAVNLPGWRWMPGMLVHAVVEGEPAHYRLGDAYGGGLDRESWILVHESRIHGDTDDVRDIWPVVEDPATAGCLLALLGRQWSVWSFNGEVAATYREHQTFTAATLGRACIAAAEALGRWPGGAA